VGAKPMECVNYSYLIPYLTTCTPSFIDVVLMPHTLKIILALIFMELVDI